ncbi:MAG: dihydrolipoyl dehydrogenase [Micavibrio aeruginosavorus]|uniref:Dihydrolipoyl dehydrogenase n=1 Tax=Micavibrio aeruginosavorus TaxID=349221 RepID=A0A7T5R406_9BACT|nr:MAG: dihydrolipoyl dehydrogenase [Micavibrio aeruginosavorus]
MAAKSYDVIVIGAGPGGYVCAIRAAQLGMSVACVENRATLGGTCLNVGCIPSKALLSASEKYQEAEHHLGAMGIRIGSLKLDLKAMMSHKDQVVTSNTKGIEYLFKKNKVDWLKGKGVIAALGQVQVGAETYSARHIVIATGSDVVSLPGIAIDEKRIVSSTGALALEEIPKSLVVIGGGVIGLELGAVWRRLGAEVTVVEFLDRILPGMDAELSREMQKILTKQGIKFKLSTKVTSTKAGAKGVDLTLEDAKGGNAQNLGADIVLVAVGRKAYTDGLGLDKVGVKLDERGRVVTDKKFATNVAGIYAIGDVIAGPMLAHKAEDEGMILAEMLAGQSGHIDYDLIPGVVYTWPEVAAVGKTEQQLKDAGIPYKVGKFPFSANGRARAMNATDGFVKILAHEKTDRVLGVHIIGPEAGTLIAEATLAMEFGASAEDIARTCHAHPTLEEVVKEAALAVDGRPIHI